MLEMISHGGQIRSTTCVTPRQRGASTLDPLVGTSLCEGIPPGVQPLQNPTPAPAPATASAMGTAMGTAMAPSPPGYDAFGGAAAGAGAGAGTGAGMGMAPTPAAVATNPYGQTQGQVQGQAPVGPCDHWDGMALSTYYPCQCSYSVCNFNEYCYGGVCQLAPIAAPAPPPPSGPLAKLQSLLHLR
jgi:hypothetical protein